MNKPNFFIIGAPKCGTTALSEYLKSHENIYISSPKEPCYFAEDFNRTPIKTLELYLNLFKDCQEHHLAIGEASVYYLCSDSALEKIYKFNPKAKIIVMLRNPIELVYSYHSQLLYNTGEDEPDFAKAWQLQAARREGKYIPKNCKNPKALQYKSVGQLGSQVEHLLKIFPEQQVNLILFDDFKESTKAIYEEVLSFLNVPKDQRNDFPVINYNKKHKVSWIGKFTERTPPLFMQISNRIKKSLKIESFGIIEQIRQINSQPFQRIPLKPAFEAYLKNEYQEEVEKLSKIIGKDLQYWIT